MSDTPTCHPPTTNHCAGCATPSNTALCPTCTAKLVDPDNTDNTDNKTTKLTILIVTALIIMIICAITITTASLKIITTT